MPAESGSGDPRSIVTPDAFSVTPELLGTPLAEPWRRFAALMVDLVLIGFLQLLGWRVLGGLVGLTLFIKATRRRDGATGGTGRKFALGCAGAFVMMLAIGVTFIPSLVRMAAPGGDLPIAMQLGTDTIVGRPPPDPLELDELTEILLQGALEGAGADSAGEGATAPNIAGLVEEIVDAADDIQAREERIQELEAQLAEAERPSTLFTWIRDAADEAGLVFGWGTIYLTLFLALWGGRTPGKKLFGLRVVRLNGQPLGLYMSLERAGGYAAGLATGLLGFAQVWWDPNRQAIHDKVAETVVVREGLPRRVYGGRAGGEGAAPMGRAGAAAGPSARGAGVAEAAGTGQDSGGGRGGSDGGAAGENADR